VETLGDEVVVSSEEFVTVVETVVVAVVMDPELSVLLASLDVKVEPLFVTVELVEVVLFILEVEPVVDEFV